VMTRAASLNESTQQQSTTNTEEQSHHWPTSSPEAASHSLRRGFAFVKVCKSCLRKFTQA
jgi:hypothetical protein